MPHRTSAPTHAPSLHHPFLSPPLPLPFTLAARTSLSPESLVTPSSRSRFRPKLPGDIANRDELSGGTGGGSDTPVPGPPGVCAGAGAGAERKSNQSGPPLADAVEEEDVEPWGAPVR